MKNRNIKTGFTLVEIIVAVAIFLVLMSGLALLFTGSLRAVRQTNMRLDAFDRADTALQVMKNDLTTAFTSAELGDVYSFYGTPTGMTFIGTVKANPYESSETHIARITYVIFNDWNNMSTYPDVAFPEFDVDVDDNSTPNDPSDDIRTPIPGYGYQLIRYVEPGVGDLESFPVKWSQPAGGDPPVGTLSDIIDNSLLTAGLRPECESDFVKAKKCELWIRMLGGGDAQVPNAWVWDPDDPSIQEKQKDFFGKVVGPPDDYMLAENIMSPVDPVTWKDLFYIDPDFAVNVYDPAQSPPYSLYSKYFHPFFDYDSSYRISPEMRKEQLRIRDLSIVNPGWGGIEYPFNPWWNDYRGLNCDPRLNWRLPISTDKNIFTYCEDVRLPQIVNITLSFMFEAKDVNSADFNQEFTLQVTSPTAYRRDR